VQSTHVNFPWRVTFSRDLLLNRIAVLHTLNGVRARSHSHEHANGTGKPQCRFSSLTAPSGLLALPTRRLLRSRPLAPAPVPLQPRPARPERDQPHPQAPAGESGTHTGAQCIRLVELTLVTEVR
jgi:hypothetical protein